MQETPMVFTTSLTFMLCSLAQIRSYLQFPEPIMCVCTCLLKCLTSDRSSKLAYWVMSVPPTCKGVLESEDATDETARGQELGDWTVGGTNSGREGVFDWIGFK